MKTVHWEKDFFDKLYWSLFMKRPTSLIKKEAQIILNLSRPEYHTYLDACCGIGDIAQALVDQGKIVTGVEYSKDYIDISKKKYPHLNLIKQDILDFHPVNTFDVVYNWFSSFGYFEDKLNRSLMKKMFNWVSPNGNIILETYNSYDVIKNFKENFIYNYSLRNCDYIIKRNCRLDHKNRKLVQDWSFFKDGRLIKESNTFTILYLPDEIISMLNKTGFKNIAIYGTDKKYKKINLDDFEQPRIIFKGEK